MSWVDEIPRHDTYDVASITQVYPGAKNISVYLQPGTGHGLALSTNANPTLATR